YSALKKKIYDIAAQTDAADGHHEPERAGLLAGQSVSGNDVFIPLLDRELEKIVNFYTQQEKEVLDELEELRQLIDQTEEQGLVQEPYRDDDGTDEDEEDDDDETTNRSVSRDLSKRRRKASSASDGRLPDRRSSAGSYDYDIEASVPSMSNRRRSNSAAGWDSAPPKTPLEQVFRFMGVTSDEPETIWTARTDFALDTRMLFKRRITTLYISATSLRSYVELNQTGFRKVLKKYEKVTMNTLKDSYLHGKVELAYPFQNATKDRLSQVISDVIQLYARCVTRGSISAATKQLKIHQREQIVWERDTVWRQMIGRERRGESDGQVKALGGTVDTKEEPLLAVPTPIGKFSITSKGVSLVAALLVFGLLLTFPMVEGEEANRCFAILCFSTVLWATEAIPLFVTSMMVPLLVVMLRVVKSADGSKRLNPSEATK
ncbi:low-affinity phosphate transporter, partial [Tulasnella sp. 408]